ncbi:Solute carrier family 17 member 9 [Amphibalanus amphitrite]|uniref:Solute carrier family 17 member 9 n=1 Tax=Amphibalanus amphitrite TaxID=1232801 RepID=A0A6A4XGN0_AMPAM|nr:Solute carrier family 17 member 9 [Amphibalanus amphitrite]
MDMKSSFTTSADSKEDMSLAQPLLSDKEDATALPKVVSKSSLSERSLQLCMLAGCGAVYAGRTVIPLVVPEVAAELGWNSVLVGYVLSFFFWGYAMTQVLGGYFADRIGGARVIVLTQAVGAASLLLFPAVVVVWPAAAVMLRCLLGLVQGPHYPSLGSLSSQLVSPARRARFLSICFLGSPLGTVLVALVGSAVLQKAGWRLVVTVAGFLSNLAAGFLLERFGNFSAIFQMAATVSVAGAVMFGAIGSAERLQL